MLHPEITCPYCRMGFGGHMEQGDKVVHLDIIWTSDAGIQLPCHQTDILERIERKGENGYMEPNEANKPIFDELAEKFATNPDDFTKETADWQAYQVGFQYLHNYGEVEGDDEEPKPGTTWALVKEQYEAGVDLKSCYKSFLQKVG